MDKTLGASNVVNAGNIEPLIDEMKQTLTEEIKSEAEESIATAQRDAASRIRRANERRRAAEQDSATLAESIASNEVEDAAIVDALLDEVSLDMRNRRRIVKWAVGGVILLVGVLPLLTEQLSDTSKTVCLLTAGILGAAFAFLQIFDRPVGIDARISKWGKARLSQLARSRGINAKLAKHSIEEADQSLRRSSPLTLS